jgi:hypothetical protein
MENSYVFRTLQTKLFTATAALVVAAVCLAPANAVTYQASQTFHAGTKIACVLDESFSSATAKYGDKFKLRIVDTSHPALAGGHITGWITDVTQPSGGTRAKITFFLTTIHLANGTKKSITAYVVNRRVTPYNPTAVAASRNMPPPVPNGVLTPGPIAWQMNFGGGSKPSVSTRGTGTLGGTIYAQSAGEPIVIASGAAVTVELQQDLTIP